MPRLSYLLALALFCAIAPAQDIDPETQARVNQLMNLQRSWGSGANSAGTELTAAEINHLNVGENTVYSYMLKAKGLPFGLDYEVLALPTMAASIDEVQSIGTVYLDDRDGRVLDQDGTLRTFIIPDPAPGEPYRFGLVSKDKKYKAFVTILPNPIEGSDQGCKITVVRLLPNFGLAFLQASGFPPQTELNFHGNSAGEVRDFTLKTNDEGYADAGILPGKKGKSKGSMQMQVSSAQCAPKASFNWDTTH